MDDKCVRALYWSRKSEVKSLHHPTNKPQICASIPACRPFFSTYMPRIFGSLATIALDSRRRSRMQMHTLSNVDSGVVITAACDDEVMDFERALKMPRAKGASVVTYPMKEGGSMTGRQDCIRITQTVEMDVSVQDRR